MSLYEDLGVGPDASPEAINAAFRRAAKKHHPDAGGDAEAFGRVQRAALVLRDPAKRARYDSDGTVDDGPSEQPDPALAILASAFASIFSEIEDLAAIDLVAHLRRKLQKERAEADMALRMTGGDLNRVADALKRLSHKGGGKPNVLATMLEERRAGLERQKQLLTERRAAIATALEMATDYTWRADPERAQQRAHDASWIEIGELRMGPSIRRPRFRLDD